MYPRFGDIGWITPYGLSLAMALLACWVYARKRAIEAGVDSSHIDLAVPLIFIAGVAGANWFPQIFPVDLVLHDRGWGVHPRFRVFELLILGISSLYVYTRLAGLSFRDLMDVFSLPVLLLLIIVRVGCFMAGCCWGIPMTASGITGVNFPPGSYAFEQHLASGLITPATGQSLPVHATQLYEMVLLIGLLLVLRRPAAKRLYPGQLALLALAIYSILRFFLEFLRADNTTMIGGLTITHIICVGLFVSGLAGFSWIETRSPRA